MKKEELRLEHLAPYLPYGLKLWYPEKLPLCDFLDDKLEAHSVTMGAITMMACLKGQSKPILRPLSEFYTSVTGGEIMNDLGCNLDQVHEMWDLYKGTKTLEQISVGTYQLMCRNRIDFNDLIGKGLAIDINTIES